MCKGERNGMPSNRLNAFYVHPGNILVQYSKVMRFILFSGR